MVKIKLIIDNRESIKDQFDDIENYEVSNLSIGDFQYFLEDELFIIIERKTIADYASSIKDGRLREQKKRLMSNKENAFVLYLVEGNLTENNSSFKYNKVEKNTIISSIINTMMRDNVNVFHTGSKMETIFFIKSIYRKLMKQGKSFLDNKTSYNQDLIVNMNCSKNKSGNLNSKLCFQMMLNCIPKISNKISQRIADKFETLYNFILYLENFPDLKEKQNEIINIKMSDDEKSRKISKTSAENIIKFLGCL